jgi:hypothetical protein
MVKYAEQVINENIELNQIYIWDANMINEIISNTFEVHSDKEILEILNKINSGEEVCFNRPEFNTFFRIATEEEIKEFEEYESERMSEIMTEAEKIPGFLDNLNRFFSEEAC